MAQADQIALQLRDALDGGHLPAEGRAVGQKLMSQLSHPTRVAVIGLAGSGKTSLINMLLGARLMPDFAGLTAVELSHGPAARVQVTMADGSIRAGDGIAAQSLVPKGALRVAQELPDDRLKAWSFVEVGLPDNGAEQRQILDWMAKRSDIAIWCSQGFDDRERALWSKVPEHLKDHSFLALTGADRLYLKGELADRIARLQPVVADEFLGLYPIATLQATAARGAERNDGLWQSSGGKALFDGIRAQVEAARMADLDHAYLLLQRYKLAVAERAEATTEAPVKAAAPPKDVPVGNAAADAVIENALRLVQDCAEELLNAPEIGGGATADQILERCSQAARDLVRLLSEAEGADLDPLREDALEGEQMLMLLRLERGETASSDALTVLLQLKKEMSARVAP